MRKIYILFVVLTGLFITSCEQEEVVCPSDEAILSFETRDEYNAELSKVLAMTSDERIAYAEENGYTSFGCECNQFYGSIDFDNFTSLEEFKSFVVENSSYIELVTDNEGELSLQTIFEDRTDRFFLNDNHMYQIGDIVYKAVAEGTVSTNIENMDVFFEVGDDISFYENDERFTYVHNTQKSDLLKSSQVCTVYHKWTETNDDSRLIVEIEVDNNGSNEVECTFYAKSQSKNWLGIWALMRRNFRCDVTLNYKWYSSFNGWHSGVLSLYLPNEYDNEIEASYTQSGLYIMGSGFFEPGFVSYDVYVYNSAGDEIDESCN